MQITQDCFVYISRWSSKSRWPRMYSRTLTPCTHTIAEQRASTFPPISITNAEAISRTRRKSVRLRSSTIIIIIIITKTMFLVLSSWQSHCESSPGSFDECRMAPNGRRLKTKPDDLGCESACTGCQKLHPPSPFIIITQPESWYSFYRPTEGRRLSQPSWLVTYRDGLPVHRRSPILILIGSDVAQLRWSRPTRYH